MVGIGGRERLSFGKRRNTLSLRLRKDGDGFKYRWGGINWGTSLGVSSLSK